ncbi:MAG: 5-formyltetrahydrofolate cyclo-ligase [Fibromonadaceae bacterium]|jgi:ribonuclease D|nr:5-formyltetrahydrofolate cyclo-ligase [Fibromonadaceae bacterium]
MFFSLIISRFFTSRFKEEAAGFIDRNPDHILVNNKSSFKKMLAVLSQANSCVMDTEADSMYHYQEKLSLIQISVGKHHWLIDPLCGLNLKPLWKCKALKNITFHACDYDLRLLSMFHGFCPEKIYDTSIAAKLLGEKQTGLAALVGKYFGIKLDKENQKADWTKRPLSSEMCRYAVLDTIYLDAMRELQCEKLTKLGRMGWLQESCEELLRNSKRNQASQEDTPKDSWRLKGSSAFKPLELQLLRAAWNWRDRHAKKRDCASYRILNPYFMLDLVKIMAKVKGKIDERSLPKLPRNMKGSLLQSFLKEINEAAAAPASEYPTQLKRKAAPRTAINEDLREKLRELRNEKAEKLKMDSGLLAKQNQLNILADALLGSWEEKFEAANFMKWQHEIWKTLVPKATLPKVPNEFRVWAKGRILTMSADSKAKESEKLLDKLSNHPVLENGHIAAFYPTELEPQIIPFLKKLAYEGRLLLPRILEKHKMEFVLVQNFEKDLYEGPWGIMEPKANLPVFEDTPMAFIVPGLVFGKDGSRIGRGVGFYDRYLASFKGIPRLSVAYSVQIRSSLPQKSTDMRIDEIIWAKG